MDKKKIILILFFSIKLVSPVEEPTCILNEKLRDENNLNFYKFGESVNDLKMKKNDDDYLTVQMKIKLKFFDNFYTRLFVSTNGILKLGKENTSFDVYPYPKAFPFLNHTLIAPFWSDINTLAAGNLYFKIALDHQLLSDLTCEINHCFHSLNNFKPSLAYIATWFEVGAHGYYNSSFNNTFQLVLTTDTVYSFLIFNYGKIGWPNSIVNKSAEIGFNAGDNINYFKMNESFTFNFAKISTNSNVGKPGKWVWRVDTMEKEYNHFLPYGILNGDYLMEKNDEGFKGPFSILSGFKFKKNTFDKFYVYTNGFITLNEPCDFNFQAFKPQRFPLRKINMIAPFWSDISIVNRGDVYFREINDSISFKKIQNDVNMVNKNDFLPKWAFVVTWSKVMPHGWDNSSNANTFQLVLAANEKNTFVIFNYAELNWPNKIVDKKVESGYSIEDQFFIIEQSFSANILDLTKYSNIESPGKYLFSLDHPEPQHSTTQKAFETTTLKNKEESSEKDSVSFEAAKIEKLKSELQYEKKWVFLILVLVILIGINSAINTIFWIKKSFKKSFNSENYSVSYNQNQFDSNLALNKIDEEN